MSIRYMKQLQNQECLHKENVYKMGYEECLQQAANFLYNSHRDICFQLMDYLKEHSNDFLKGSCTSTSFLFILSIWGIFGTNILVDFLLLFFFPTRFNRRFL